jgi:hypothetical protein
MDRFGQFAVADHVADLKVFIGNQVVRRDQRVCLFPGKIFTLPLHFQMLLCQLLPGFLSVRRFLDFLGESSPQTLELLFRFPVVSGIVYGVTFGVGQEALETNINTELGTGWDMLNFALSFDTELDIVAIRSPENTNTLDVRSGEGFDVLFLVPNQAEATYATPISEDDMLATGLKLPPSLFVLNRAIVVLKSGIALLPRVVLSTIGIEPIDSEPRTVSASLTGLGIEAFGKRVFFSKDRAVDLQVIFADTLSIHPQAQALVTDELDHAYRFFDGLELLLIAIELVFVDQHCFCPSSLLFIVYHNF